MRQITGWFLLASLLWFQPVLPPRVCAAETVGTPPAWENGSAGRPNKARVVGAENATPVPTPKIYVPRWGEGEEKQTRILGPKRIKIKQPLPRVKERIVSIQGSLPAVEAEKVLLRNLQSLQREYLAVLMKKADLTGTLTLEAELDALGVVAQAKVSQDRLAYPELAAKTLEFVQGWVFPAPTDGQVVQIIFEIRFDLK